MRHNAGHSKLYMYLWWFFMQVRSMSLILWFCINVTKVISKNVLMKKSKMIVQWLLNGQQILLWHSYRIRVCLALIYLFKFYYLEKEAVLAMMDQFLAHPGFIHWPDKAKTSLITSTSSTITATITATCCIVSKSVLPIFPQFS